MPETNKPSVLVSFLGEISHEAAWRMQLRIAAMRRGGRMPDTLLLMEHPPTLTTGKRQNPQNILASTQELEKMGVAVRRTERGGDVTYHGPGQLVGYPILDLDCHGRSVTRYVERLESVFIRLLADHYGIEAGRDDMHRGVWTGRDKITAIGCAIKQRITLHGFAFNVNTDLSHYRWIRPCGIKDRGVTSLAALTGHGHDMDTVGIQVMKSFCDVFGLTPIRVGRRELAGLQDKTAPHDPPGVEPFTKPSGEGRP